ncbi:hypothetical protein GGI04_005630, partial [Coemansia thaxteri]
MDTGICDIPHVAFVAQLTRHLVSVPPMQAPSTRRGSVALVIRLVLPDDGQFPDIDSFKRAQQETTAALVQTADRFLSQPELASAKAQLLFIQRAKYPGDPWSGHIGFPGGKRDLADTSDRATAERETLEELGLDLADENNFVHLGCLDDAIAYSLFTSMQMVVSPHVYLQIRQSSPSLVLSDEVASAHWIGLEQAVHSIARPARPCLASRRTIPIDIASRLFPAHCMLQPWWYRLFARVFGRLHYTVLPLKHTPENSLARVNSQRASDTDNSSRSATSFASDTELFLWGLSLNIFSNLMDLSLPIDPCLECGAYSSLASPWPQMGPCLWTDVNYVVNKAHLLLWSPHRRKPWYVKVQRKPEGRVVGNNDDFFR